MEEEDEEEEEEEAEEEEEEPSEDEGEVPPSLKPFDARLNTSLLLTDNFSNDLGVEVRNKKYLPEIK